MAEFQSGRYKLYPKLNWYIRIKNSKVRLPIKLAKLAQLIANKYEPEMWQKYWDIHLDHHRESGKSKCLRGETPEIVLNLFDVTGRKIKMRAVLEAEGKRRLLCYESCGNINVDF